MRLETPDQPAAWQVAKVKYEADHPGKSFERLLGAYIAQNGFVWSSPKSFLLAAKVQVREDGHVEQSDQGDTWFVHLAALTHPAQEAREMLREFLRLAPHPLPWVAWHRAKSPGLHRYPWSRVEQLSRNPVTHYEHVR